MNYPGNLAGTAAAGAAYQYTYDAVGRATGVNSWDSGNQVWDPVAANGAYNAAGQILGWQEYASGYAYSMSRSYDPARGWLNSLSANSGYGLNMSYTYNANGQATVLTDWVNGGQSVTSYSYDNLNRLSGVIANNWTMAWSYDAFGNRLTQTGTPSTGANAVPTSSLTYNPNTNQIWQGNYSYDANGNMTQMPGPSSTVDSMEYDVFDRLSVLENSNNQTGSSYSYDAFGRRIAKLLPSGGVKVYFYSMRGQSLGEYDFTPSGTTGIYPVSLSLPNVYFAGQRVNQWTDRTGSKRKDNTNTNSHYYPYGEEITSTNNDTYKFARTYRDSDSGLDYAKARYYASSIGRFLSVDRLHVNPRPHVPQGWNRYAYANGDPVNRFDPRGKDSCLVGKSDDDDACDDPCDPDEDFCDDPTARGKLQHLAL
jgi:RHS repeat-associated protein